jgi:hypothetical protein
MWNENLSYGNGCIAKVRNKKGDHKLVHYRFQEKRWDQNPDMRQVIVRVMDKNWNLKIELSILSDDNDRDVNQIITLMLSRWVQENDFKYMIRHFGINQITSYCYTDYRALKDKIEDKTYICSHYKIKTKEVQKVRAKFKTALLSKHNFDQKHGANQKLNKTEQKRKIKIETNTLDLNKTLTSLEQERKQSPKFVSKIDELIDNDMVRLDTEIKSFMDAIKLLARNMFYLAFQPFKEEYNNYRDDHVLFRHLTLSGGTIHKEPHVYKVEIKPQMEYQPKIRKIITNLLDQINKTEPELPDDSRQKIKIFLNS